MERLANVIDGRDAQPSTGAWLENFEPATGAVRSMVANSAAADVDAAVQSAARAFPAWAATPVETRAALLNKLADLVERDAEALAQAESADTGKPVSLARAVDIPRSATNLRFFAGAAVHAGTEAFVTDAPPPSRAVGSSGGGGGALNITLRAPRGVAGLISPWNLPLYLLTWKIGPALATGNTAVCKPSEITPTTATRLAHLAIEAGLPPGVLNVVHGRGNTAGAALVQHPAVPAISFTGSTPVGRWIGATAGGMLKRVSLELGGKNPFIIAADAPMPEAIDVAARAAFTNQGQVCLCGSRVLIERSAFERVRDGLVQRALSLRIGDPLDAATTQGALVSAAHLDKVEGFVRRAKELGGTIHCGGGRVPADQLPARCRGGYFFQPTIISGLDPNCDVERDEIFGPVVTLQPFDRDEDALRLANATPYGLAAVVFTSNIDRAHALASRLDAGIVWVNTWMLRDLRTPFGGAKQSGVGREGGAEALKFFTEPKNLCIRLPGGLK